MKPMYTDLTDDELSKELRDYAEHRSGEISDLTYAAGLRIDVLSTRVKVLEQELCEDAISRQAVLDIIDSDWKYEGMEQYINELPPVNPQPKTGHWISDAIQGEIDGQIVKAFICSECGAISVFRITDGKIVNGDLCPNCGAKMQESEEKR